MQQHKPYKTYEEQCNRISEYGILVDDPAQCIRDLRRLGYYRLSAYWYPFRIVSKDGTVTSQVHSGTTFPQIVALCDHDEQVRRVLLNGISTIEIGVRVAIAYQLGKYGAMGYLEATSWSANSLIFAEPSVEEPLPKSDFTRFCDKHQEMLERSREDFVTHFNQRYGRQVPVWAAIELWEFGTMAKVFAMLKPSDRAAVAMEFGVSHRLLRSWLVSINDLRNFCAHHGRISRRVFVKTPRIPRTSAFPEFAHVPVPQPGDQIRLYPLMCVMAYLVHRIAPGQDWAHEVRDVFSQLNGLRGANLMSYGVPEGWDSHPLWISGEGKDR
jgi:abortive infection bacteriophage resistance protein